MLNPPIAIGRAMAMIATVVSDSFRPQVSILTHRIHPTAAATLR
jgi:hypothetical protein